MIPEMRQSWRGGTVKIAPMDEAKQALAGCPIYHRIPLHFRHTASGNTSTPQIRPDPAEMKTCICLYMHRKDSSRRPSLSFPRRLQSIWDQNQLRQGRHLRGLSSLPTPQEVRDAQRAQEPGARTKRNCLQSKLTR